MPRARGRIVWSPSWNDRIKAWSYQFLRRQRWRCEATYGVDDLMQDAYLLFCKVRDKYPRVTTHSGFMRLYSVSLLNMMHDHARRNMTSPMVDVCIDADSTIGDTTNLGSLTALLNAADPEIVAALHLLGSDPSRLLEVTPHRENLNQRLARVLGFGPDYDFAGGLRSLLQD